MPVAEDTEITLGTGKLLAVFFGLVVVCAVFFGMGFSLGRAAAKPTTAPESSSTDAPSVVSAQANSPQATTATDLSFYKSVQSKDADPELTSTSASGPPPPAVSSPTRDAKAEPKQEGVKAVPEVTVHKEVTPEPARGPSYYVQIAAVSKEEDAEALVQALKHKQYTAFSTSSTADKFFHVQLGPFADLKSAEAMRAKLVAAGYNPILKK